MKLLATLHLERYFNKIKGIEKVIVVLLLLSQTLFFGQKKIVKQQLFWYGYYNNLAINEKWNLKSEIQERHFVKPLAQHQLVFRTNIEREISNNWSSSFGITFFLQSPNDPYAQSNLMAPELRPDLGFQNNLKYSFFSIAHRYKIEARFFNVVEENQLTNKYVFSNFRIRYQLGFDIPFWKKEASDKLTMKIKDEVMINVGNKIMKNVFDQNRIYAGLNYAVNPFFSVEVGYMNWFQEQSSGVDFYSRDILRFSVFQKIYLKKNKHE